MSAAIHSQKLNTHTRGLLAIEAKEKGLENLSCEPVWPSGKQKGLGSIPLRHSLLFKSCLWTLFCDFVPHN